MSHTAHWNSEKDSDNVIWLGFSRQDARVNTMNYAVLDELNSHLQTIAKDNQAKGLVIYSAKSKGFIAGADVHEFSQFTTPEQAADFLKKGQAVIARLENLSIPTVAMIHGFCMGGGLELALGCDYRIASDDNDTRLGLPEILLGIHPGWGGSVRLARLIGGFNALTQVMLTGQALSARRAKALGFIDEAVPYRQLRRAVIYYLKNLPPKHKATGLQRLTNQPLVRPLLAALLRRQVAKRVTKAHYPAPFALIERWEQDGGVGERAFVKEAKSVENLVTMSDTSKNLVRLFGLRERMKALAKDSVFQAKHVHVIGAGVMGGDIAAVCALRGLRVTLQDQSYERIAPAIARAYALFCKKLKQPRLVQAAMDRLVADPEGNAIESADVIIEAVFENLTVKQELFKTLSQRAKKEAILATNTSSIPLEAISATMKEPHRLIGIHFFNPVPKMELVEVVSSAHTHVGVQQRACAFVLQLGKLPLPVKSSPGFLINRVLMPYLMECMQLMQEGYSPCAIDSAACSFGMMMGPVEMADTVGLDVCLAVAENLTAHFGGEIPSVLREKVGEGKLGRKTGEGFYVYKKGKPVKPSVEDTKPTDDIAHRLVLRMINESLLCLREGVVADADLLDAGMVFGSGFAPFRGGPLHYAEQWGKDKWQKTCTTFATQYGERFKLVVE